MDADILEIVYYQMLELENRLDKKIELIEKSENELKKATLELQALLKEIENLKKGN